MLQASALTVRTGSRLHFGLWAWGEEHARQFGGVGMMVDQPALEVRFAPAPEFRTSGAVAGRLRSLAESCKEALGWSELPPCAITTPCLPLQHAGFGVGTQLGLAVIRGLTYWSPPNIDSARDLVLIAGRAKRSSVGTHGFVQGGFLVDNGQAAGEDLGPLAARRIVPAAWRVVLITERRVSGAAGQAERDAFAKLPAIPSVTTEQLKHLALEEMIPALDASDFNRFAAAVFEYGHRAGQCFSQVQGGPYASARIEQLVQRLRGDGVVGVGQSSWGPTVFAFTPTKKAADELGAKLAQDLPADQYDLVVARPKKEGAELINHAFGGAGDPEVL